MLCRRFVLPKSYIRFDFNALMMFRVKKGGKLELSSVIIVGFRYYKDRSAADVETLHVVFD